MTETLLPPCFETGVCENGRKLGWSKTSEGTRQGCLDKQDRLIEAGAAGLLEKYNCPIEASIILEGMTDPELAEMRAHAGFYASSREGREE